MNKVYGPWTTLASWSTVDSRRARAVHLVEAKRAGRYGVRDLAADAWGERGQRAELTSDGDERWGGEFGRVTKGNESCAAPVLHSEQRERKLGRGVSSVRHQRGLSAFYRLGRWEASHPRRDGGRQPWTFELATEKERRWVAPFLEGEGEATS
jgi:hypothetical protein